MTTAPTISLLLTSAADPRLLTKGVEAYTDPRQISDALARLEERDDPAAGLVRDALRGRLRTVTAPTSADDSVGAPRLTPPKPRMLEVVLTEEEIRCHALSATALAENVADAKEEEKGRRPRRRSDRRLRVRPPRPPTPPRPRSGAAPAGRRDDSARRRRRLRGSRRPARRPRQSRPRRLPRAHRRGLPRDRGADGEDCSGAPACPARRAALARGSSGVQLAWVWGAGMNEKSRAAWMEFRAAGLLWWLNRSLHLFGWAIVLDCECDDDGKVIAVTNAYPQRVKWRGFPEQSEEDGFKRLSAHLESSDCFKDGRSDE